MLDKEIKKVGSKVDFEKMAKAVEIKNDQVKNSKSVKK
jgi:hypothetical protein